MSSAQASPTPTAVRPEPVEGRYLSSPAQEEGVGFDKLSPNGGKAGAIALPLRIGARTLARLSRRLHPVPVPLQTALAGHAPELPILSAGDGYMLYGAPTDASNALCSTGLRLVERQRYQRHYADLSLGFDAYLAGFSAKRRATLRRKEKRLAEACGGVLDIRLYRTPGELRDFHDQARRISARTYQERLLDAGLPDTPAFRAEMLRLAEADRVRAWLLFLKGEPIAYLYAPAEGQALTYAYLGYDPAHAELSPGTILQLHAMRMLMEEGAFRWFDFTGGEGEHKRQFATGSVKCMDALLLRPGLSNLAVAGTLQAWDSGIGLAKRMVATLHLEGLARTLRR